MDALQALKLAKQNGGSVRAKHWEPETTVCTPEKYSELWCSDGGTVQLRLCDLINPDGSPVEWEVVPDQPTGAVVPSTTNEQAP